jgi:hypothetical protein
MTAAPAIRGYVEGRGGAAIHGWAWDAAAPDARLGIELRQAGAVVARGRADLPRPDLAQAGMGDGAHGFRFLLPESLADRADSLMVVALDPAGQAHPLEGLPADDGGLPLAGLRRGLQQIAAAQRATLRLLKTPPPEPPAAQETLARLGAMQEKLEAQIGTLEVFVTRLDSRLAALGAAEAPPPAARGTIAAAVMAGAAAAAMTLALAQLG